MNTINFHCNPYYLEKQILELKTQKIVNIKDIFFLKEIVQGLDVN